MLILGLTGSIASGKSSASTQLRRLGVPVHDADAAVHALTTKGGKAIAAINAAFPGVISPDGVLDRGRLGAIVFADPAALKRLEAILHPLVIQARDRFLRRWARAGAALVVLDIPLLFEVGMDRACDLTVTLTVPPRVQEARVLRRPGMTRAKLAGIRARQLPDREKARLADFAIPSGAGKRLVLQALRSIVRLKPVRPGRKRRWPPGALPRYDRKPRKSA